jgi:hypothetical protein
MKQKAQKIQKRRGMSQEVPVRAIENTQLRKQDSQALKEVHRETQMKLSLPKRLVEVQEE